MSALSWPVACVILLSFALAVWAIRRVIMTGQREECARKERQQMAAQIHRAIHGSSSDPPRPRTLSRPDTPVCPVENCRIQVPHSHTEARIKRLREK